MFKVQSCSNMSCQPEVRVVLGGTWEDPRGYVAALGCALLIPKNSLCHIPSPWENLRSLPLIFPFFTIIVSAF